MRQRFYGRAIVGLLAFVAGATLLTTVRAEKKVPTKGAGQEEKKMATPAGAVVLFSGKEDEIKSNWVKQGTQQPAEWKLKDGAMYVNASNILSKQEFQDFYLHIEFKVPFMPNAKGQGRGNSGIGLLDRYEVQVLDSFGLKMPGKGDCGAIYDQFAPLVNATTAPETWQTYDIIFRAPRFADGKKNENARVTVMLNGVAIQNNVEMKGVTGIAGGKAEAPMGPIHLQNHGNPVGYRNIWVLPLPLEGSKEYDGK